jgi:hypothetical protein
LKTIENGREIWQNGFVHNEYCSRLKAGGETTSSWRRRSKLRTG